MMLDKLTHREYEVLDLIGKGMTTEEIAKELMCSFENVRSHRKKILQKLAAKNTAQAVYNWLIHYDHDVF